MFTFDVNRQTALWTQESSRENLCDLQERLVEVGMVLEFLDLRTF